MHKTFSRVAYLKLHKCKGSTGTSKSCKVCKKQFQKVWHLNRHMKAVHTEHKYKCVKCKMTYKRSNQFEAHNRKCVGLLLPKRSRQQNKSHSHASLSCDGDRIDWSFLPSMANLGNSSTTGHSTNNSHHEVDQAVLYSEGCY